MQKFFKTLAYVILLLAAQPGLAQHECYLSKTLPDIRWFAPVAEDVLRMKKMIWLVGSYLHIIALLPAQHPPTPQGAYQSSLYWAPIPAFNNEKAIQLGYEHRLGPVESLLGVLSVRYAGEKGEEELFYRETQAGQAIRSCSNGILLPVLPVVERCNSWRDTDFRETSRQITSEASLAFYYRRYLLPFSRNNRAPDGFYLAGGWSLAYLAYTEYEYARGEKGDVVVLDSDFKPGHSPNPWGVASPWFDPGFVGTHKVIEETIYEWEERTSGSAKEWPFHYILQPGMAFVLFQRLRIDAGAEFRLRSGEPLKQLKIRPALALGCWF